MMCVWEGTLRSSAVAEASLSRLGKELLGHSRISVTLRYAHANIDSKRAAVEKLDGFGDNLATVPPRMHQSRAVLSLNRIASHNV